MNRKLQAEACMLSPPPQRPELSDTPLKFCNEIARLFRAKMRNGDEKGVLSQPGAGLILSMLAISDGVNQRQLVKATHLRPPTVSVALKQMEQEGLVELRSDPDDLRSVRVYLTELGRELDRKRILQIHRLDHMVLEGISEQEIRVLMELLTRIRNNFLKEEQIEE